MSHLLIRDLSRVGEEYAAARAGLEHAEASWPSLHRANPFQHVQYAHVRSAVRNVENTYLIRLFAEFEGLLRQHLAQHHSRRRAPRIAQALVNRVAALNRLPDAWRHQVHTVREYRNFAAHPGGATPPPVRFFEALSILSRFLSGLPDPPESPSRRG